MSTASPVQNVPDANGKTVAVIVPIGLWREIESERETAYLLKSEALRQRLLEAKQRTDGRSIEDVRKTLGICALVLLIIACLVAGGLASESTAPSITWKALREQVGEQQAKVNSFEVRFQERVLDTTRGPKESDDLHRWTVQMKADRRVRIVEVWELLSVMDKKPYLAQRIAVSDGRVHKSYYPKFGNVYPAGFVDKENMTNPHDHEGLLPIVVRYRMLEWMAAKCPGLSDDQVSVRTGTVNGKSCLIAAWTVRGFEREVYLDRTRDLVPLRVKTATTKPYATRTQLQWDIQYSDKESGFLLSGWKYLQSDAQGHIIRRRTVKAIQCKVNPDIADSSFQLDFPVGTYVTDHVANENYILKENSQKRHVSLKEWQSGATYESLLRTEPKAED